MPAEIFMFKKTKFNVAHVMHFFKALHVHFVYARKNDKNEKTNVCAAITGIREKSNNRYDSGSIQC